MCCREELLLRCKPVDPSTAVRRAALLPVKIGFGSNLVENLFDQSVFSGFSLDVYGSCF